MTLNKQDHLKTLLDLENCAKSLLQGISRMRFQLEQQQSPTKKKSGLDINQKLKLKNQLIKMVNKGSLKKVA